MGDRPAVLAPLDERGRGDAWPRPTRFLAAVARNVRAIVARAMRRLDAIVRLVVHLRVPLLGALALLVLPWVMRTRALFANLFELTAGDLLAVGVAAGLAGWTCVMTGLLVLRLAPDRYHVPRCRWVALAGDGSPRHRPLELLAAFLVGCAGLAAAGLARHPDPEPWRWPGVAALAGGAAAGILAVRLVERFAIERLLRRSGGASVQATTEARDAVPNRAPRSGWLRDGYLSPGTRRVLPGHLPALSGLVVLVLVYAWLASRAPQDVELPVLAMLVFALALLVSGLTGITFFCDRFGVPLLLVLVVGTAIGGFFSHSTHLFFVRPSDRVAPASVAAALAARLPEDKRVVVVCAEGGGIQAAAWTAEVLVQLDREVKDFHRRLALISAVSGGSAGAMHYLARFDPAAPLAAAQGDAVRGAAAASSLLPVGWALVFKDLRRPLGVRYLIDERTDRSLALEDTWRRHLGEPGNATLGGWAARTAAGMLPPVVFNATLAGVGARPNKGRRLMLATIDFGATAPPQHERLHDFFDYYGGLSTDAARGYDVDIVTAVRMSATFPYVTPLARAADVETGKVLDSRKDYVADGGYFDNSGIATAMDWMLQALGHDADLRVALVLVRSFPESLARESDPRIGAWANAAYGPLDLMLATRASTQQVRADIEAQLVSWGGRVRVFTLQFDTGSRVAPPLSWHLSKAQRAQIAAAWTFTGADGRAPKDEAHQLDDWCGGR